MNHNESMGDTTAEALLQELRGSSPRHAQFFRTDLLELVLAQSHAAQLTSPDTAASLADLAIGIAERIDNDPDTSRSALVRAHCLAANAYRLGRLPDIAEGALTNLLEFLHPLPGFHEAHRALYCRTLALVRWDQGRLDEAISLLQQARDLFDAAKARNERITCELLLGLLHDEMGDSDGVAAIAILLGLRFDHWCRPWLTSRVLLTFTAVAAEDRDMALFALDEALRFQAYVSDDDEQLRLLALEGRARARLGFFDEAEQMIEGVRRQYLAQRKMVDLTLSSLDLLALRAAMEQPPGIDELLDDIKRIGYDSVTSAELASSALDRFASCGDEDPWTSQRMAATWYLQMLRLRGSHPSPLPFA